LTAIKISGRAQSEFPAALLCHVCRCLTRRSASEVITEQEGKRITCKVNIEKFFQNLIIYRWESEDHHTFKIVCWAYNICPDRYRYHPYKPK